MTDNDSLQTETGINRQENKTTSRRLSKVLLIFSGFLCILLLFVYTVQPDFCAAVTFWPVWIWAILGIALSLAAIGVNKKARLTVIFIWVLLIGFLAEEPLALLRSCIYFNRSCKSVCTKGICLRVISLNCAGGTLKAAKEIFQYEPDMVLIQESPPDKDLKILIEKLFDNEGEYVLEGDTAILTRGHITKSGVGSENRLFMVGGHIRLVSGVEIEAVSVHLNPPAACINLLSPACWREHFEDRRERIKQIIAIKEYLGLIDKSVPLVVGGDFNTSPWTGEEEFFSPELYDSFKRSGVGWSGTGPSNLPLWRVDQIWTSRHFKPIKVYSENCSYSDHRIVICDLCRL